MIKGFLKYNDSKVHYLRYGEGEELLICLHGFGDRANMFLNLQEALSSAYTVYAVDLPYHGQTEWGHPIFSKKDIIAIINLIILREEVQNFSLMGFSFGGRIVQSLLDDFEKQLKQVFLIAPDGIETKWMFNFYLVPQWFRYVAKWGLSEPSWFIQLMSGFKRVGLVSKFVHDFAVNHISTKERRDRIFCTWLSLNDFKLHPQHTKKKMKMMGLPIFLFFGKRDEVIPVKAGEWMADGLPNAQLHVLAEGHLLVDQELNDLLKKILLPKKGYAG